jgi:hypothetical protein
MNSYQIIHHNTLFIYFFAGTVAGCSMWEEGTDEGVDSPGEAMEGRLFISQRRIYFYSPPASLDLKVPLSRLDHHHHRGCCCCCC